MPIPADGAHNRANDRRRSASLPGLYRGSYAVAVGVRRRHPHCRYNPQDAPVAARSRQTLLAGFEEESPPPAPPAARAHAPVSGTSLSRPIVPAAKPAPVGLAEQTVWIVDANSLIFQVFHAIPEMTSPQGEPVNAVYGFTRDLFFLIEQKKPDYLLVAFDRPEPTFRHELYTDYKGQRAEMPVELIPQFPKIRAIVEALSIPILELPGYEADDMLATVARLTAEQGGHCYVVSADKDCRQLLGPQVSMFNIRKNSMFDAAALLEDWGVRPEQVVDFQSLVGDSVDNVPGVPGIGPKTASELLAAYGTLEGVLEHAGEVKAAKRRQALLENRELALLSRQLVRLDTHVPAEIDWAAARIGGFHAQQLVELLGGFGFRGLTDKARELSGAAPAPAVEWHADYRLVNTPAGLAKLVEELTGATRLSVDTETTSVLPTRAELVGISLAWQPGVAYYIAVRGPAGETVLPAAEALEALRPTLESDAVKKVGQNLKYDLIVLRRAGVNVQGLDFDTMVASYVLEAGERNHNLDDLAKRYLQHQNISITSLIGSGKNQRTMDQAPLAEVTDYAAEDADVALRLTPLLESRLDETGLIKLYREVELPLIDVLVELECNGIRVDVARLAELSGEYGRRMEKLEGDIHELAGGPFNVASPKQLAEILFERLKLPVGKKTKTGPSTDVDVLEELAALHPLPAKIIEYRQYAKLKGTYVDALPVLLNPQTGRVHASFNQVVAATGRLSSSDPNLQNIPIRTREGREIRSAFLPGPEGWLLLAADYSQIELRVLAHFCQDEELCRAFAADEDIHARVAAQVNGVALENVTPEMRRTAKAVNFGVIYGQSPFGLAKQLGIPQTAAAEFIDAYFARYRGVEQFISQVLADCRKKGYVETILGRRRAIQGVRPDAMTSGRGRQLALPERTAINTVIQGSAADLIKLAMLAVHRRMRQEQLAARMLLQIHDELVFEVPPHETIQLAALVVEEMTAAAHLRTPLKVDVKTGRNWADVEPWG